MSRKSATRWSLGALIIVVALIVAIWPRGGDTETAPRQALPTGTQQNGAGPGSTATEGDRAEAGLAACPAPTTATTETTATTAADGPLAGLTVECLADGTPVDLGAALAGRPALLNLWAYWCGPCARELPVLQQFAERAGGVITVLTVHEDPKVANALERLSDYGVRLPGVQDGSAAVAAAVGAPRVLPVSVLVAADGSIASVLPQPFDSVEQIADAVRTGLGVDA